jgi:antitoxin (DNA-binding transcriptional repressor) of toxin-antitoxin stability system
MKYLVLTAEQMRVVCESGESLEVRDEQGRTVAHLTPLSPADREAVERSREALARGGPRVPSAQVAEHLKRLDEIHHGEGMDEGKMLDLLRRMRAGEQV